MEGMLVNKQRQNEAIFKVSNVFASFWRCAPDHRRCEEPSPLIAPAPGKGCGQLPNFYIYCILFLTFSDL
jgi:hypothetical protein